MCRAIAYMGAPLPLETLLYRSDSSLVRQAYDPQMLSFMNLAGIGVAAWSETSADPEHPFLYRSTTLPMYDQNLIRLSRKVPSECAIAHVRGADYFGSSNPDITESNLHPFLFEGTSLAMAHNGALAGIEVMKYDLLPHMKDQFSRQIRGTTDSEWFYALLLSQLEDPEPELDDMIQAIERSITIMREVRARHGIEIVSGTNLFLSDGRHLLATRFSFDFGCYEGSIRPTQLLYHSLWFTAGTGYGLHGDEWGMTPGVEQLDSILIASEPLTVDTSTWIEVPEYTLIAASRTADGLALSIKDLDR
jgi:glutamine amidotransferase